jgi:lysophospholipase L1-like esterase
MIIGDSIAYGISRQAPQCIAYTKVGINSYEWKRKFLAPVKYKEVSTVVISLGTNDSPSFKTNYELDTIRKNIHANNVYWVLPNPKTRYGKLKDVKRVAKKYGDVVIENSLWSSDHIHPTVQGYRNLSQVVQ